MQRRVEQRGTQQLVVRVWGMDGDGKPFTQSARTLDTSANGARLHDVPHWKAPGEIIGVSNSTAKAKYKVMWIGQPGTPFDNQIGIRCLDIGRCIFGTAFLVPDETGKLRPQHAMVAAAAVSSSPGVSLHLVRRSEEAVAPARPAALGQNRRKHTRYSCNGGVQVRPATGTGNGAWGRLTDISLGGCYVESVAPLPLHSAVELTAGAHNHQFKARGRVQIVHPMVGMGIEFTLVPPEHRENLQRLIISLLETAHHA